MKPKLYVQMPEALMRYVTMVETDAVRERFDVSRGVEPPPAGTDLAYTPAVTNVGVLNVLRAWGGPYVTQIAGDVWHELKGSRLKRVVEGFVEAAVVACMSKYLKGFYSQRIAGATLVAMEGGFWGMDHSERGVKVSMFTPKDDWRIRGNPLVVMSISMTSTEKWKHVPEFVGGFSRTAEMRGVRLACYGKRKRYADTVKGWMRKWPFFDSRWASAKDWADALHSADLFVHPTAFEGWGRVVADSMCTGLPCVAYRVGSVPEVGSHTVLCEPGDYRQMVGEIERLLDDEGERERLGMMARREALEKTEKHRGDYAELLAGVLGGTRGD